jgi:hypothetical protein
MLMQLSRQKTFRGVTNRSALAVLAVLVLVGIGLFLRYWMTPPTKPDVDVGRKVAEQFLAHIRDGQAGAAWDNATAEFKSIEGRESFERSSAKAPVLKQETSFVSMQEVRVKDEPRAEYIFQSAEGKMVRVLVGYEAGAWKVDRLTL